jgi:hypothetical protein
MNFPDDFDLLIYKNNNSDLLSLTDDQIIGHYKKYGMNEGRICNEVTSRHKLVTYIQKNKEDYKDNYKSLTCLEIGPFNCPVLTGKNIKYFEVLDKDELKCRAISLNRNPDTIPDIDYIDKDGNLQTIKEKFELVLSCHSIEHQIDFIKHLNDVSNLLNENGLYVVILPDKRYCFDHFIRETTIADILYIHNLDDNLKRNHSLKSVIEHRALTCHNNSIRHWNNDHGTLEIKVDKITEAINEYNTGLKNNKYIDVHSLQFTPTSFSTIISLLYELKYIDFKVKKIYPTVKNSVEFFVILEKV